MKNNEPVITFDHMEDEKSKIVSLPDSKLANLFELAMFVAEEMLAFIILISMLFLL